MAFSTERSIIAQNAANVAAQLTALTVEEATSPEQVLEVFNLFRTAVFEGTLTAADDPDLTVSTNRQPRLGAGGGSNIADVLSFGKYKGQTWKAVVNKDRPYVEWLAQNSTNDRVRERAQKVLATRTGAPADVDAAVDGEPF